MRDPNLVPLMSSATARAKHRASAAWTQFARRIQLDGFMRLFILKRDGHRCVWCDQPLREAAVLHHTDFDHECAQQVGVAEPPAGAGGDGARPDCRRCNLVTPAAFAACARRLVSAHPSCSREMSTSFEALRIRSKRLRQFSD